MSKYSLIFLEDFMKEGHARNRMAKSISKKAEVIDALLC